MMLKVCCNRLNRLNQTISILNMTLLTKTEKKIRLRTAKRIKNKEKKFIPKASWLRKLVELWCFIERKLENGK